ncbi:hypothetical protein B9Z55_007282 [Caenorhabditis nigoni]|uniref:Uncharacterized protein n=1 Tax=Caenorhabditis nigoni TaxID=1611254 RepID=A0A2G5V928_9PELO|nr:hypothetical protein B9Z55_007282 [Caenorhabditis nigoni]
MNQFEREQAQIKAMWRRVYELRAMSEEMHFRREATKREIETYPQRHENRMRVVRIVHWANVNNAIRYAAELTRRVECMDRVEEKQKRQLEMLKKAGDAIIVAHLRETLQFVTGVSKDPGNADYFIDSAFNDLEKKHEVQMEEFRKRHNEKVDRAIMYAAEMERRVESLERNEKKQKEQSEKLKEVMIVLEAENAILRPKIARMKNEISSAKRKGKESNRKKTDG